MVRYFDCFNDIADLHSQWHGSEDVKDDEVLLAVYSQGSYDGDAWILIERDGKLYEATDSHCSCNGLENFVLEETTVAALKMRNYSNRFPGYFNVAFNSLLDARS